MSENSNTRRRPEPVKCGECGGIIEDPAQSRCEFCEHDLRPRHSACPACGYSFIESGSVIRCCPMCGADWKADRT